MGPNNYKIKKKYKYESVINNNYGSIHFRWPWYAVSQNQSINNCTCVFPAVIYQGPILSGWDVYMPRLTFWTAGE